MLLVGYIIAMRDIRFDARPGYESVVLNYDAQAKFGAISENVPSASVRIKLEKTRETPSGSDSVRFL